MNAERGNYECRILNYELSWRDVGIAPLAIAQHFVLFTLHFSLPLGTTFHFSLCTFNFPQGHFSLISRSAVQWPSQRAPLVIAARCIGHRSVLRFSGHLFCAIGRMRFPPLSRKLGVRCTACFGMVANVGPRTVNFVNSTFFSPLAGMLERIFVNLQAGRTGGAMYVALREDDIGSLIYK